MGRCFMMPGGGFRVKLRPQWRREMLPVAGAGAEVAASSQEDARPSSHSDGDGGEPLESGCGRTAAAAAMRSTSQIGSQQSSGDCSRKGGWRRMALLPS